MNIKLKGVVALLVSIIQLSLLPVLLSFGSTNLGTLQLLFYTFLLGTLSSLFISYSADRFKGLKSIFTPNRALLYLVVAGILNFAVAQLLLVIGINGTNANIGGILSRSWVIMAAILSPLVLRQKVSRNQYLAMAIGFVALYITASAGGLYINTSELPYVLILFTSAFLTAISNIIAKKQNSSVTSLVVIFNSSALASVLLLSFITHTSLIISLSSSSILTVAILGILSYSIGGVMYFYAIRVFNPAFVGNMLLSIPFLTVLFSFAFLGLAIHHYYIYASILLGVAIYVQTREVNKAPEFSGFKSPTKVYDVSGAFVGNTIIINSYMRGNGKALATKFDKNNFVQDMVTSGEDYIMFTDENPHPHVNNSELDFVKSMLVPSENEVTLITIGKPSSVERAMDSSLSFLKQSNKT